jgi:hypothetical protein
MELSVPDPKDYMTEHQSAQDDSLLVKFYIHPRPDRAASALAGHPVMREVEFIDIRIPGSRDGVARPASEADKRRFPRHYAAFKQRGEMPSEGMPLTEWPPMTRSYAEQLSFLGVKTVEQLAGLADSATKQMMGLGDMKRMAERYLAAAKADAPLVELHTELEQRDAKIEAQELAMADMADRLKRMEAALARQTLDSGAKVGPTPEAAAEVVELVVEAPKEVEFRSVLDRGTHGPDVRIDETPAAPPLEKVIARATGTRRRRKVEQE